TRHGSRFGYSLLKNVGLDELIAYNRDEYVQKAVALAKDRETLQALRDNLPLIVRKSPLMDIPQYVSEIEAVYEKIYADKIQEMSET
ncbi:MAG: UDP-N-acetylglucosamine-peptide N-acetylglucosaminyltransferase, partial [Selenomonas sp.]|nr:UDP-N-acetylglucosamine-peptide N-acetylglucosaminyltransferase [Selenomonas sp.]